MKIFTHPDNANLIKRAVHAGSDPRFAEGWRSFGVEIHTNPLLPKEKPSGRVRLPDGSVVRKEDFQLRTRFITYGPEDLHYFLWTGEVTEEMEAFFYVVDESMFRAFSTFDLSPAVIKRPHMIHASIF
jgi:hypothetical protein